MSDTRSSSPSHTLDVGVLLLVLGALLAGAMLLEVAGTLVRRQLEPLSLAESRCEGLVPPGLADSAERSACVRNELSKSDLEAVGPELGLALTGALSAFGGGALLFRRRVRDPQGSWVGEGPGLDEDAGCGPMRLS